MYLNFEEGAHLPLPLTPLGCHLENFNQFHCFSSANLHTWSKLHQNRKYLNFGVGGGPQGLLLYFDHFYCLSWANLHIWSKFHQKLDVFEFLTGATTPHAHLTWIIREF